MHRKLKLSRETLRALAPPSLTLAHGAMIDVPTRSCYCTIVTVQTCSCKPSVCDSCFDSDCCLASVRIC